ncbi:MAG: CDP-alcohol phosphatidyltransferase family protein [Rhodothermales bacterium]|nr:CDP-alcohol phosphatidyltransferase family protein [Rhodothermales bacterium]
MEERPQFGKEALGHFWTGPNVLTLSRLVLIVPLVYLIATRGSLSWILILTLVAGATDWFDGRLARWSHSVTNWGKVLDPLVDKTGAGLIVLALVWRGDIPLWFLLIIVARDLLVVAGGVRIGRRKGIVPSSILAGKLAVTAVAVTVLAAILEADPPVMRFCLIVSTVLIVHSFFRYMAKYFSIMRADVSPASSSTAAEAIVEGQSAAEDLRPEESN